MQCFIRREPKTTSRTKLTHKMVKYDSKCFEMATELLTHTSCIKLSSQVVNDDVIYEILMNSELPNLSALRVECNSELTHTRRLTDLVINLGNKIEKFFWDFCANEIDTMDVRAMLKSMPHLTEINIYNMKLNEPDTCDVSKKTLNITNLKSLSCYCSDSKVHEAFLNFSSKHLRRLTVFAKNSESSVNINRCFRRNKTLRKVSLYGSFMNLHAIRHLTQLNHLYIEQCVDSKTFNAICQLRNLSFLDVSVTNISSCVVPQLRQLSCLKNLVMRSHENYCNNTEQFEQLSLIHIPNLRSVQLEMGNVSTSEATLAHFGSNFPHLESFEMRLTENRNIYDFIVNLKQLESLSLNFSLEANSPDSFATYFAGMQEEISEINLRNLSLNFLNIGSKVFDDNDKTLLKIVNFLPSLRALSVQGIVFSFEEVFLKNLWNVWHRIEELDLNFVANDCKDYKNELKHFIRLMELLDDHTVSLSFSMQCLTHFEALKTDFKRLGIDGGALVEMTYDDDYFKIQLDSF